MKLVEVFTPLYAEGCRSLELSNIINMYFDFDCEKFDLFSLHPLIRRC